MHRAALLLTLLLPVPVALAQPETAPDAFWARLHELCGKAYAGQLVDPQPQDASFAGQPLVMHVRDCSDQQIRIPLHVGDNRSRTWVLTRTPQGLRLKHDHRHEDGSEDRVTQYGGDSRDRGSASAQAFPADAQTAALIPAAASNVWTLSVEAGHFEYRLERANSQRRFQARFDLRSPVPLPPPAWGAR